MTTQQKITAIQAIAANHQDNVASVKAAKIGETLYDLVVEAMNTAFKDDLAAVFAVNSSGLTTQNVQRERQT